MAESASYKLSEILASDALQEKFHEKKEKNWEYTSFSKVQCNEIPTKDSTIYIKLISSTPEMIHCIALTYTDNEMQGGMRIHYFVSNKHGNVIYTSDPTFKKLCSDGKVLSEQPQYEQPQSELHQYTIRAILTDSKTGDTIHNITNDFSFSPDTKISDVSKNVFLKLGFDKTYTKFLVLAKITNITDDKTCYTICDKDNTLDYYEKMYNMADSTFTITFVDTLYVNSRRSREPRQYQQNVSNARPRPNAWRPSTSAAPPRPNAPRPNAPRPNAPRPNASAAPPRPNASAADPIKQIDMLFNPVSSALGSDETVRRMLSFLNSDIVSYFTGGRVYTANEINNNPSFRTTAARDLHPDKHSRRTSDELSVISRISQCLGSYKAKMTDQNLWVKVPPSGGTRRKRSIHRKKRTHRKKRSTRR